MLYILASNYNRKLYQHFNSRGITVQYVPTLENLLLSVEDTVILDGQSQEGDVIFSSSEKNFKRIIMGEETRTQGNIQFVSKYQPIESICSILVNRENFLVTLIGGEALFNRIMMDEPNCNFIDFTYTPEFDLTLIQILDKSESDLLISLGNLKNKILYPITSVMDMLDPPVNLIRPLMDTLKKSRKTIVRIDYLKGPLDLILLNLSDFIIIVHEDMGNRNKRFDSSLANIFTHKKIVSLNASTKAYEHFKLSDHMIYDKEP